MQDIEALAELRQIKQLLAKGSEAKAELLDAEATWTFLGLSKSTFYRELSAGKLPDSVTICGQRRWRRCDLLRFIAELN